MHSKPTSSSYSCQFPALKQHFVHNSAQVKTYNDDIKMHSTAIMLNDPGSTHTSNSGATIGGSWPFGDVHTR